MSTLYRGTSRASRILKDISDCLCDTIEEATVPGVCFCGVIAGDALVTDYAGNCKGRKQGMAWVRQTSMYPAVGLNVTDETPNNMASTIGMDIEVGIIRPVKIMDARGNPPTPEEYKAACDLMNDDAVVILKAIKCCGTLEDMDSMLGTYQSLGPIGGVLGGTWGVAVLVE